MKHYLVELFKNPKIDDPANSAPAIHKHFTRYSRGEFDGPVFKIKRTASKISVWCSYEYEDLAVKYALQCIQSENVEVKGNIVGSVDFSPLNVKLGLDKVWNPTKSKGKAVNYTTKFTSPITINKEKLLTLLDKGDPYMYFLLNITDTEYDVTLKIKGKPPRPSSKNPEDAATGNKLKFCTLKMANTPENVAWIMDGAFADVLDEIPEKWKALQVENSYTIDDLELPPKNAKMSSRKYRLSTVRIGKINRIFTIDGETITKHFEFKA